MPAESAVCNENQITQYTDFTPIILIMKFIHISSNTLKEHKYQGLGVTIDQLG
ncbi:hypothetical protein [Oceanobacillus iheyensis]|uniref:hypothetical protein n=1 Tax=Oceanobacillus iheyensis TaxID=182710 RepID=UPI0003078270|nr:hypothetical protein [Oceanobacillus iheyensis]